MVRPNDSTAGAVSNNSYDGFGLLLQQQQQQIQQLTTSVNQYFQTLLGVQKDVSSLQRMVDSVQRDLQQQQQRQERRHSNTENYEPSLESSVNRPGTIRNLSEVVPVSRYNKIYSIVLF